MACTLSNLGIQTGCVIQAKHVSQSVDAFTKAEAYDVTLSGSLTVTGSLLFSGSELSSLQFQQIPNLTQNHLLNYNCNTGAVGFVCTDSFVVTPSSGPYLTGSNCAIRPVDGNNGNSAALGAVLSGFTNIINDSDCSVIVGGTVNQICQGGHSNSTSNFIGGGQTNRMCAYYMQQNVITGGQSNRITGSMTSIDDGLINANFIGAGASNHISGSTIRSAIVSGCRNKIVGIRTGGNPAQDNFIGGGACNVINSDCIRKNFIGAGENNTIDAGCISPSCIEIEGSSVVGGYNNTASVSCAFIAGGRNNYVCHNESFILGSCITSCAVCTTHVNNLNVGCTTQMQLLKPIGTGQAGMLVACDAGGGAAELYFHDGTSYKKVCLVP